MQLTIKTFPKQKPNITLQHIFRQTEEIDYEDYNKDIRLAKEMAKQMIKEDLCFHGFSTYDFYDLVRKLMQNDISNKRINAVLPFKKIIYEKVIEMINGKPKTVKRLRKRRKSC